MRLVTPLVARGLVTHADVETALDHQEDEGGRLGENLLALGKRKPRDLETMVPSTARAARQMHLPRDPLQISRTIRLVADLGIADRIAPKPGAMRWMGAELKLEYAALHLQRTREALMPPRWDRIG